MIIKMNMKEFVERQEEFKNYIVRFTAKRKNDGQIFYFERIVNDRFCNTDGEFFVILEVEILRPTKDIKFSDILKRLEK